MIDNGSEILKGQELQSIVERIRNKCLIHHQQFDKEWRGKGRISYHNENHINATLKAASCLINAAFNNSSESNDPLNLRKDLEIWNKSHSSIAENEFDSVVQIAFACHDLGNIASGFDEKDNIVYLDKYQAKDAEERSKKIAEHLISKSLLSDNQKQRFLPLVNYLIDQTKYFFDKEGENKPFARFVRVVDQIGGNLFNDQKDRTFGLIEEFVYEEGQFSFVPANFFNFVRLRFPELVTDKGARNKILEIFGKDLPPNIDIENNTITVNESNLEEFFTTLRNQLNE